MSLPRYTRSSKCFSLTFVLEDLEGEPSTYQRGETIDAGRNVPEVGFVLEYLWNIFSRSDILDVAKAGIEFHQHQRELEVDPWFQLLCLQVQK